jgi:2-polyprenyl-3-methyl-5-hydroxy-6-metoxy-1,4-benzoquinol methylase
MIFLIGGHRCGTTHFHKLLLKHYKIKGGSRKEIEYYNYNYHNGFKWYKSQCGDIDSSTGYLQFAHCAYRIKRDFPNALIIVLLRNPIDRAYSHYWQYKKVLKKEKLSFSNAIRMEPKRSTKGSFYYYSYLSKGLYADQLPVWLDLFKDNIIVIKSEDFFKDRQKYLNMVFDKLNIKKIKISAKGVYTRSMKYPPMNPKLRYKLENFYDVPNRRLYDLTGITWERTTNPPYPKDAIKRMDKLNKKVWDEPLWKQEYDVFMKADLITGYLNIRKPHILTLNKVDLPEVGKCLEVGCANGVFLEHFKTKFPKWKLVGLDLSESMLEIARKKDNTINYLHTALESYKTREKYDLIACFETLEHVFDEKAVLTRIHRLIKKKGVFIGSIPLGKYHKSHSDARHFTKESIKELLKIYFKEVHIEEYEKGRLMFWCDKKWD